MTWASRHIAVLLRGETVQFRPRGHSMAGRVSDGQLVTVTPISDPLKIDDIVLCRVNGRDYLHLVKAISDGRALIGNNKGGVNGWTSLKNVFGRVVRIDA